MLRKKLTRHGKGYALIINKPIRDLLKIGAKTRLKITTDGQSLIISPTDSVRAKTFDAATNDTFKKYSKMLKRLAR